MNRKQFLWLMLAVVIMCGAGFALFWQDITAYRDSGAKIGAQLLPQMKVSDVAKLRLQDATGEVTLAVKDKVWRVEQRGGYPADFAEISGLILKLLDVKVVQSEAVGASLHGRLNLLAPGKDTKEGTGTLVELSDAAGKVLVSMVLGKVSLKKDPMNPLPNAKDGVPAGRHILVAGKGDNVFVVSDPLEKAVARPGAWLAKDFFKIDRIKTLQLAADGGVNAAASSWKITRDEEWGQWKFATGGGQLHPSAAVTVNNAWSGLAFTDVILDDKTGTDKAVTFTAQTFDDLTYTVKLAPHTDGDYVLRFSVAGTPPKTRKPEPKEKAEDAAKLDKEFAENRQRLEARVMLEQARSQWAYVVPGKQVAPLLLKREQMVATAAPAQHNHK
ncbi:MAG: DUF4340 domain-containing protein [Burkholderiales bacterium]|jgi:hypothetical protein|nr:DUF4340 domain-containing protein [Burkholderiales bacterium]